LAINLDDNRLVQQWLWFSVRSPGVGYVSNLINNSETGLTLIGQTFHDKAASQTATTNLLIDHAVSGVGFSDISGSADVPIRVAFRNNGNQMISYTHERNIL
jgi:hypothetical protein